MYKLVSALFLGLLLVSCASGTRSIASVCENQAQGDYYEYNQSPQPCYQN